MGLRIFDFGNLKVIVGHLLFWAVLLTPKLPLMRPDAGIRELWLPTLFMFLILVAVGFTNAFVLVPRFFRSQKFVWYVPTVMLMAVLGIIGIRIGMQQVIPPSLNVTLPAEIPADAPPSSRAIPTLLITASVIPILAILFVSLIHRVVELYLRQERRTHRLKEAQLQSELKFLRNQINPHFLFNTLNNLYAMVHLRPEVVGDLILSFGDILRYVTYECHQEQVQVSQEVQYIENYLDLQRVKDTEFTDIQLMTEGNLSSVSIEPMLLIPFVENAFKHSYRENGSERWVNICVKQEGEGVSLSVKNNLPEQETAPSPTAQGGVGIQNVRQRLELRYGGVYRLETLRHEDHYEVSLWVNTHRDSKAPITV